MKQREDRHYQVKTYNVSFQIIRKLTMTCFSLTLHVVSTRIKENNAQLSAMIGTNRHFAEPWSLQ